MGGLEKQEDPSFDKDDRNISAGSESSAGDESRLDTDGTAAMDTSSQGEASDRPVAEATIVLEDGAEPSGSVSLHEALEDSEGSTDGPTAQRTEGASSHASVPEAAEGDQAYGTRFRFRQHLTAMGGLVVGICMSLLASGLWCLVASSNVEHRSVPSTQVYRVSVEEDATIVNFSRFLILFAQENDKTYLSFSVSARPLSSAVYREISQKRIICRKAIYGVVGEALRAEEGEVVTIMVKLKQQIMDALNSMLATGKVDWIGFTDFLMV